MERNIRSRVRERNKQKRNKHKGLMLWVCISIVYCILLWQCSKSLTILLRTYFEEEKKDERKEDHWYNKMYVPWESETDALWRIHEPHGGLVHRGYRDVRALNLPHLECTTWTLSLALDKLHSISIRFNNDQDTFYFVKGSGFESSSQKHEQYICFIFFSRLFLYFECFTS